MRRAMAAVLALALAGCTSSAARPAQPRRAGSPASSAETMQPATTQPVTTQPVSTRPPARRPTRPAVPPISAAARAAGLRDVRTVVPDAVVDLRYTTARNFVGVRLYPRDARCLVHRTMTHGLAVAARRLRQAGYLLVFWDCYRPHAVQVRMFEDTPNPAWVARPGPYATSHEAGRSVDVTLARAGPAGRCRQRVQGHCLLDMGTGFDDFTPRAYAYATYGVSARAQADRALLRGAMAAGGLAVYSGEWWHFDGPGALVERPILNAPLH